MNISEMKVYEYNSNNSGGSWWLSDEDWINLEKAGWTIIWGGWYFCGSEYDEKPKYLRKCKGDCKGHRKCKTAKQAENNRWLGCLAKTAYKKFDSEESAVAEWEEITGQDYSAQGCPCCGDPHYIDEK